MLRIIDIFCYYWHNNISELIRGAIMEVDSNVETKANSIEYLKSIDVKANNIQEEYEFDNYIVSIVMVYELVSVFARLSGPL